MPTLLDDDKVYEMVIRARADGQAIVNILHYITEESPFAANPDATMEAFLDSFAGAWQSAVVDHVASAYVVDEYALYEILQTSNGNPDPDFITHLVYGHQLAKVGSISDIGAIDSEPYPTSTAVGYKKVTAMRGRSKRGGLRIGPPAKEHGNFDLLNGGGQANFAASNLDPVLRRTITLAANFPMVLAVFSKTRAQKTAASTDMRQFAERVTSLVLNTAFTSQVSRKRRIGKGV
jgi:hypothetical protein